MVEADFVERIEDILTPVLGPDRVKAQVVADLDFTRTEQTRETYNPDLLATRSEHIEEQSGPGPGVGGIPGALSNQPPGPASAPEQAGGGPPAAGDMGHDGGAATAVTRRVTRNFEVDRTLSHTEMPVPALRRLSVAVVLDNHRVAGTDGEQVSKPMTPEELDRFTGLVREAVGYDPGRGDSVQVVNIPFVETPMEDVFTGAPLWQDARIWDALKQLVGIALVLFIILGVLRPAARRLSAQQREESRGALTDQSGGGAEEQLEDLREDSLSLSGGTGAPAGALTDQAAPNQPLETVRNLAIQEPERVAKGLQSWVNQDE
jgi:flagellar M-ring protein FliF